MTSRAHTADTTSIGKGSLDLVYGGPPEADSIVAHAGQHGENKDTVIKEHEEYACGVHHPNHDPSALSRFADDGCPNCGELETDTAFFANHAHRD